MSRKYITSKQKVTNNNPTFERSHIELDKSSIQKMAIESVVIGKIKSKYFNLPTLEYRIHYRGANATHFYMHDLYGMFEFMEAIMEYDDDLQIGHRVMLRRGIELLRPAYYAMQQDYVWWDKKSEHEANILASIFTMRAAGSMWNAYVEFERMTWDEFSEFLNSGDHND